MNDTLFSLWPFLASTILLFLTGLYCVCFTYNLIRVLIGLELLVKAVTLLFVVVGYANGKTGFVQAFVITLIIVEVVVITVAAGVVIGLKKHNLDLDTRNLKKLKG